MNDPVVLGPMIESGKMVQTFTVRVGHNRDASGSNETRVRADCERDACRLIRNQTISKIPGWHNRAERIKKTVQEKRDYLVFIEVKYEMK